MDPFTSLRLNSLFASPADPNYDGGPQMGGTSSSAATTATNNEMNPANNQEMNPDIAAMMSQLYQPNNEARDKLNEVLSQQPQAPQPGLLRRLIAGGLAGIKNQENIRMEPLGVRPTESGQDVGNNFLGMNQYHDAVNNWKTSLAGAESAAQTERLGNTNQRTSAVDTINSILKQKMEMEKEQHDRALENQARARAQIQGFAEQNKEWKFTAPKGGNYTFINPLTGEKRDTGIPTGTLSQMDEMSMNQAGKEIVAGIHADTAAANNATKGWTLGEITDPNDPTGQKKISVRMNADTGEVVPIQYKGKQVDGGKTASAPPVDNAQAAKATQEIQDKTRDALSVVDELLDEKGNLKSTEGLGFIGSVKRHVPGTQAYNQGVIVNRLKGMLTLDLINQMRAASRSGSTGFGRITNQELTLLENAASQLDPSQSPEKFQEQLKIVREKLNKVLLPADSSSPTATAVPGKTKPTAADLIKKYGGGGLDEDE